jgi:rRNA maturation RNase YbeY
MEKVLKDLGCPDHELSVLFCDDAYISALNANYMGKKGPTNVLAFPMDGGPEPQIDTPMLGDVVVSLDTAAREADSLDESLERRVHRLLVHGILHLRGFDHERSPEEAEHMEKEEKRLMALMRGE